MSTHLQSPPDSNDDLGELNRVVTELRYENDDLRRRNEHLLAIVSGLNGSIIWRILQRFRGIAYRLLPPGTRRGKFFAIFMTRLKGSRHPSGITSTLSGQRDRVAEPN